MYNLLYADESFLCTWGRSDSWSGREEPNLRSGHAHPKKRRWKQLASVSGHGGLVVVVVVAAAAAGVLLLDATGGGSSLFMILAHSQFMFVRFLELYVLW